MRNFTPRMLHSSKVAHNSGVRSKEFDTAPLAWLSPKLSPHTLPILLKMDYILLETLLLSKFSIEGGGVGCLL